MYIQHAVIGLLNISVNLYMYTVQLLIISLHLYLMHVVISSNKLYICCAGGGRAWIDIELLPYVGVVGGKERYLKINNVCGVRESCSSGNYKFTKIANILNSTQQHIFET